MNTCKILGCSNTALKRSVLRGAHHGMCSRHFWVWDRLMLRKNYPRDEHRCIAFGQSEPEKIRCKVCKDTPLNHFNKHCRPFYTLKELRLMTDEKKIMIGIKQFEVDHINGRHGSDREYNLSSNLQILCTACHKYKTLINSDLDNTRYKKKALAST